MTVQKPPNRNLPDLAVPWGRWVENNITAQDTTNTVQQQALGNALKAINGSLKSQSVQILRAQQRNSGGYAENLNYSFGTTDTVYSGPVVLTPPSWATSATIVALSSLSINVSGTRLGAASGYLYIGLSDPIDTYFNNMVYLKRSQQFKLTGDASTGRIDPPSYPSTGYVGPITPNLPILVGIAGSISGTGTGTSQYSATATAIVFWS